MGQSLNFRVPDTSPSSERRGFDLLREIPPSHRAYPFDPLVPQALNEIEAQFFQRVQGFGFRFGKIGSNCTAYRDPCPHMDVNAVCPGRPQPQDYKLRDVTHRNPTVKRHSAPKPAFFARLIPGIGIKRRAKLLITGMITFSNPRQTAYHNNLYRRSSAGWRTSRPATK